MSSVPLISHHLFVAAVNEKSWVSSVRRSPKPMSPAGQLQVRELPLELVEFGRPLSPESAVPFNVYHRIGST
jgi:hypothetical protein